MFYLRKKHIILKRGSLTSSKHSGDSKPSGKYKKQVLRALRFGISHIIYGHTQSSSKTCLQWNFPSLRKNNSETSLMSPEKSKDLLTASNIYRQIIYFSLSILLPPLLIWSTKQTRKFISRLPAKRLLQK